MCIKHFEKIKKYTKYKDITILLKAKVYFLLAVFLHYSKQEQRDSQLN